MRTLAKTTDMRKATRSESADVLVEVVADGSIIKHDHLSTVGIQARAFGSGGTRQERTGLRLRDRLAAPGEHGPGANLGGVIDLIAQPTGKGPVATRKHN